MKAPQHEEKEGVDEQTYEVTYEEINERNYEKPMKKHMSMMKPKKNLLRCVPFHFRAIHNQMRDQQNRDGFLVCGETREETYKETHEEICKRYIYNESTTIPNSVKDYKKMRKS